MVVVKIASLVGEAIIKYGPRAFKAYNKTERKIFTSLYGHARGRGVRHGLAGGSAIGSLINNQDDGLNDAKIPIGKRPKTSSSNQARNRRFRNSNSGYYSKSKSYKNRRCSCHSKYNRMRNR